MTITLIAVFISVAMLTGLAANWLLSRGAPGRKRLRELTGQTPDVMKVESNVLTKPQNRTRWFGVPRADGKPARDPSRIQRNLRAAGYKHPAAGAIFSLAEVVLPLAAAAAVLVAMGTRTPTAWVVTGFAALFAWFVPGLWLETRMAKRRNQIRQGLPDVLDLLIVCLEAGSSLDQAIVRASEDLDLAYPPLAEELRVLQSEIRAGKPRLDAFRSLANRTKVDEVRSLVGMLVQTDRFGTSVSQALRTFANAQRIRRRQEAEERAAKVAVKLVFPLVFCMFPALYVVVLGSAMIQIYRSFAGPGGP